MQTGQPPVLPGGMGDQNLVQQQPDDAATVPVKLAAMAAGAVRELRVPAGAI